MQQSSQQSIEQRQLSQCKQLTENDVKRLCDKVCGESECQCRMRTLIFGTMVHGTP